MVSFWCLSILVSFSGWNAIAEEQDLIAPLKQQCDELERKSKWSEAIALAEKILALTKEKHGEQHADTVDAMHTLARMLNNNRDHTRAEQLWHKTLTLEEELFGKDSPQAARSLRTLANLTSFRGESAKAEELLLRALQNLEPAQPAFNFELGKVLHALGCLYYYKRGDLNKSEPYLLRAVGTLERCGGASAEEYLGRSLGVLGQLYISLSDLEIAEPLLVRALRLCERNLGLKNAYTAIAMRDLAGLYSLRRDFAPAEPLFRECLAIEEEIFDSSERDKLFYTLQGFGTMYLNSGQLAKAEPLLTRALSVAEVNARAALDYLPLALSRLGLLNERKGDYKKAADFFEQARQKYEQNLGRSHIWTISRLRELGRVRLAQGRSDEALSFAEQIQEGEEKYLADGLSFTSERQRLVFMRGSQLSDSHDLWATLGAARPLARAVLRTKGIVLDSLLEDRLVAEASANAEVRQIGSRLANAKQRLSRLSPILLEEMSNSGSRPLKTNEIEAATRQVEFLEASLARRVTALGGARRALATRVEVVQASVPKEAALVEMLRYQHYQDKGKSQANYGALILFKAGEPVWVRCGPAAPIDKNIKLYQHLVRSPAEQETLVPVLRELYDQVWQPVQSALSKEITHVIISPDSELSFVSFVTLLTPAGRFVGEDFHIGYVSTARDLLADSAAVTGLPSLAVWANPDFSASEALAANASGERVASRAASTREFRDLRLQPLPGSEKEGKLLSEMASEFGFKEVVLHLGPGATETELRRVHSPRVLHLATHGFVLPELSEEASAASPDAEFLLQRRSQVANNPMLRSGLALAGARRTIEAWARGEAVPADNDGIVTAEEIAALDLKNTWLVVLSGCDTGSGEARSGEGVLGLRRGFIQAGAKNLLMTLWPIEDERTADLIADFYHADKKHCNAAEALSVTQRKWLARLRTEKGIAEACRVAGPFILSFQGRPFVDSATREHERDSARRF